MTRKLLTALVLFAPLAAAPTPAWAGCTDPAEEGVNWRRCSFYGRDLGGVTLVDSQLRDAIFQRATLDGADLSGADAFRAKFNTASLVGALLEGARLFEADLTGADLSGADLGEADLSGATWTDGERVCAPLSIGQCN